MNEEIIMNDIIEQNEVVEVAEEIVEAGSGKWMKLGVGGLITAAVAVVGYKLYKKYKAKKEEAYDIEVTEDNSEECQEYDCED